MMMLVMRKYMSSGSAPSQKWTMEMHRKQGENATWSDVWDRIKTCAAALESCGRIHAHLSLIDALKQNLGPAHVSWVNDLDDSYTLEDVDAAVYNKGMFIDHREGRGDSSGKAAYPADDQADARDLTMSELAACIARLEDRVNQLTSGSSSKDNGRFTGTCHYCKKPGHKISDCKKLKDKNRASKNLVNVRALVAALHFRRISLPTATVRITRATAPTLPAIPPYRCFPCINILTSLGTWIFFRRNKDRIRIVYAIMM